MEDAAFGSDKEGRLQAFSTATQSTTAFRAAFLVTASGRNLFHESSACNSIISNFLLGGQGKSRVVLKRQPGLILPILPSTIQKPPCYLCGFSLSPMGLLSPNAGQEGIQSRIHASISEEA